VFNLNGLYDNDLNFNFSEEENQILENEGIDEEN